MSSTKIFDDEMAIGRGWSHTNKRDGWIEGDVITPHGIVTFYAQGDATHSHASRLDFAFKNRLYIRNFDRRYSSRGLSTLGKRFAAEVVSRKGKTVLEH